jgi:hypothetical protein
MPDLSVEVQGQNIVVTKPSQGLAVMYRKEGPMLVALDPVRDRLGADEAAFLVTRVESRVRQSQGARLARPAMAGLTLLRPA